ncbi:MAG: GtrA family protein [Cellulomonadaceae bacterium]|nr:GtrA family protein [Cellulomonadaceae bacterium]
MSEPRSSTEAVHDGTDPRSLGRRLRDTVGHSVIARFASVGVVNTLVDLGLYVLFRGLGMPLLLANTLSTSAGMAVSFFGNRSFVFGATDNRRREITLFVIVCGLGIWVVQPAVIAGVGRLAELAGLGEGFLVDTSAKIAAILVAAVWNFVLYGRVVFRGGRPPREVAKA